MLVFVCPVCSCLIFACVVVCKANDKAVIVYPLVSSGSDGASMDCPCAQNLSTGLADQEYYEDYGVYCKAWDSNNSHLKVCTDLASSPPWCWRSWCYVDATTCNRSFSASVLVESLHFSYQTCGSVDFFSQQAVTVPPGGFYNGLMYNGLGSWQPSEIGRLDRVVVSYARELLNSMGIDPDTVKHRPISPVSKTLFASSYTAVAHDMALGHIHFGMYAFWQTSQRIDFGISPIPLYSDAFYFYTSKKGERRLSFLEILYRPLKPFRWDLWCLIIGTVVFAATNLVCVEFGFTHVIRNPKAIIHIMYDAFLSLFSAALVRNVHQPAARVIALGFSIFIVIIIASFTGNTTFFLMERHKPRISTFEEAMARREPICIWSIVQPGLVGIYPVLSEIGVAVSWSAESPYIFDHIQSGVCAHGIASITEQESPMSCSFARSGDPLISIPTGPFVRKEYANLFSFFHSKMAEAGIWGSYKIELFQYSCPQSEEDIDMNTRQLTAEHMLGICLLLIICSAISVILHLCALGEKKIEKEVRRHHSVSEVIEDIKCNLRHGVAGSGEDVAATQEQEYAVATYEQESIEYSTAQNHQIREMHMRLPKVEDSLGEIQTMLARVANSLTELKEQSNTGKASAGHPSISASSSKLDSKFKM